MSRPFMSWSIVEIEAEFERAKRDGDEEAVTSILHELTFRNTKRAGALQHAVKKHTGGKSSTNVTSEKALNSEAANGASANGAGAPHDRKTEGSNSNYSGGGGKFGKATNAPKFKPTPEQDEAIANFSTEGSLKINAFAGTGKTSTLELLAHSTKRRGQYIAFNRAIVEDAREKFPSTVNCATSHGLALQGVRGRYRTKDKLFESLNANQLVELFKLKKWRIDKDHTLQPRSQGYLILETVRRFAHSADPEIKLDHVPRHGSLLVAPTSTIQTVTDFALNGAKTLWQRMTDERDAVPLGHDGYLKQWALSSPTIAADYILLDEAQDTNPVVLDVLRRQSAQMIYVGDKHQQIYEWRGAVNAMERIETDTTTLLTTSFRFGNVIASAASNILALLNERVAIRGNPSLTSRIAPTTTPDAILARTNASAISAVIEALDRDQKPHLVGGKSDLMDMLRGVVDLKEGRPSDVRDFFGFANWQEVVEFAKSDEGAHLLTFVNLVESRGERKLMWALNRTVDEEGADVTISTAHKAKGREWKSVRLMDDFLRSQPNKKKPNTEQPGHDPAELRLFYVAFTRAREAIEVAPTVLSLLQKT